MYLTCIKIIGTNYICIVIHFSLKVSRKGTRITDAPQIMYSKDSIKSKNNWLKDISWIIILVKAPSSRDQDNKTYQDEYQKFRVYLQKEENLEWYSKKADDLVKKEKKADNTKLSKRTLAHFNRDAKRNNKD